MIEQNELVGKINSIQSLIFDDIWNIHVVPACAFFVLFFVISCMSQFFNVFWIKYEVLFEKKQNLDTGTSMCSVEKVRTSITLRRTMASFLLGFHQELKHSMDWFPPDLTLIDALTTSHAPERSSAQSQGASSESIRAYTSIISETSFTPAPQHERKASKEAVRGGNKARALDLLMISHAVIAHRRELTARLGCEAVGVKRCMRFISLGNDPLDSRPNRGRWIIDGQRCEHPKVLYLLCWYT